MKYSAPVRYGNMHFVDTFLTDVEGIRSREDVVVQTERGVEIAVAIGNTEPVEEGAKVKSAGKILRVATRDDLKKLEDIINHVQKEEFRFCQQKIAEAKLPMKLVDVEHLFGGNKIIFYFLADGRVDFRALVRTLAKQYRTRIEMKQIGVRDEARLLASYEHCGRPLCCKAFLNEVGLVTMKMAKIQKTTLDPGKISGRCGRLMCCFRFENDTYIELRKGLPKPGYIVRTKEYTGPVVSLDILNSSVTIHCEDGVYRSVARDEILEVLGRKPPRGGERKKDAPEGNRKAGKKDAPGGNEKAGKKNDTSKEGG